MKYLQKIFDAMFFLPDPELSALQQEVALLDKLIAEYEEPITETVSFTF